MIDRIYLAQKKGVYYPGVVGTSMELLQTLALGLKVLTLETDEYHDIVISRMYFGEIPESVTGPDFEPKGDLGFFEALEGQIYFGFYKEGLTEVCVGEKEYLKNLSVEEMRDLKDLHDIVERLNETD